MSVGKLTRSVAAYPGAMAMLWWSLRKIRWNEIEGVNDGAWKRRRAVSTSVRWITVATVAVAAFAWTQSPEVRASIHAFVEVSTSS